MCFVNFLLLRFLIIIKLFGIQGTGIEGLFNESEVSRKLCQ